jgi:DUF4097 and DUF4098 domain-containing protein YvlB
MMLRNLERQRSFSIVGNSERKERTMQTFTTTAPITAVVDIPAGHIRITATDRTDTTVQISPADPARSRDTKAAEQTTVEFTDSTLQIRTPNQNQAFGPSGSIDVTVHLPAGSHLRTTTAAAELRTTGPLGQVAFEGAHGPIALDQATDLRVSTNSGDITVAHLTGPAHISTQQGDIHITQAAPATLDLRTMDGSVTVDVAPGLFAVLDAQTQLGRIHNALANTQGTDAPVRIHAETMRGDITARGL